MNFLKSHRTNPVNRYAVSKLFGFVWTGGGGVGALVVIVFKCMPSLSSANFLYLEKVRVTVCLFGFIVTVGIFQYRLTYFIVILKGLSPRYNEQFSLLHF